MNVQTVTAPASNPHISYPEKISPDTPAFTIPWSAEQTTDTTAVPDTPDVDPVSAMESMTGKTAANEPSYSVTDEEAEYFREKYGDTYDENAAGELYYELADKGIISINDASSSSGTTAMIPLSAVKRIVYFGTYLPGRENMSPLRSFSGLTDNVVYIKDISRKDKDAYKYEWERFKSEYDREIVSWKDAVQESIDFERYLKDNSHGRDMPSQWHFDNVIENLEKTKEVIFQIFGE
ncbi:MAG: hypothetical protein K2J11_12515 [Oscillospiraceae bacterium]|nr:hypothetical protein [Oscillospiraceae bacterium]